MRDQIFIVTGGNKYYSTYSTQIPALLAEAGLACETFDFGGEWPTAGGTTSPRYIVDFTYGVYGQVANRARNSGFRLLGNSHFASLLYDKVVLKEFLIEFGFPTPRYIEFASYEALTSSLIQDRLRLFPGDVVVKPACVDALSRGVFRVTAANVIYPEGLSQAFEIDNRIIAEEMVFGKEYCAGFVKADQSWTLLPIAEVKSQSKILDFKVKAAGAFAFDFSHGTPAHYPAILA